jgi:electron transport complex protein RnfD
MRDVIIAMIPAMIVGIYNFGARAAMLILVSVVSCVVFEALYQKLVKKEVRVGDLSAVVTGILLAFNLSVAATWWMAVIGSFFAIVVVKQLFGGIGKNFVNPALAGRAFLVSWVSIMTQFVKPGFSPSVFGNFDVETSATPLFYLKDVAKNGMPDVSIMDMFLGNIGGCIGEVSALMLILGGIYLIMRKVITPTIPLCYIGTVAVFASIFPRTGNSVESLLMEVLSGGLLLGAIFMATDYATSPVTPKGQVIFGIGCGLLTIFIRYFGGYPEGVSYSILLMNLFVWLIDKYTSPKKFGKVAKNI